MEIVRMTYDEWAAEGERRFGTDRLYWRFVCPVCGHVQSGADFLALKRDDAWPENAVKECIGRYTGAKSRDLSGAAQPCDYAGYGLIRLSPVRISDGAHEYHAFAFGEPTVKEVQRG